MTNSSDRNYWTDNRLDRLANSVQELTHNVQELTQDVQELTQDVKGNTAATRDLRLTVETQSQKLDQLADEAKADRIVMHEMIDQLVTLRDNSGQQRGNGHGDQPEDDF